jgi:hypothetical protein
MSEEKSKEQRAKGEGPQQNYQSKLKANIPFATGNKVELLTTRDQLLVARYYYYFHLKRMREDDVFNLLSKQEFFIVPDTIYRRVVEQNHTLNELIKTNASAARLARMYPTWKW